MGDMNAKFESCNISYEEVICTHGFGGMNNDGKRFADARAEYELVIGEAVFHTNEVESHLGLDYPYN